MILPVVSMVIPCYNKEQYIGDMLNSLYNQTWPNIEIIFVNDGSTDKTRDILSDWEPRLQGKGQLVKIIDQKNMGVASAVHQGMLYATGDFFCTVDCDDILDREYLSTMARFLCENDEFDWVACDYTPFTREENGQKPEKMFTFDLYAHNISIQKLLENLIFWNLCSGVWVYLVRMRYLKKCRIIENFSIASPVTQEPQYVMPLICGGGKLKYLNKPLYYYNIQSAGQGRCESFDLAKRYVEGYHQLNCHTIDTLGLDLPIKQRLKTISGLFRIRELLKRASLFPNAREIYQTEIVHEAAEYLKNVYQVSGNISGETILVTGWEPLVEAIEHSLFASDDHRTIISYGRIICYGALGKAAKERIPIISKIFQEPLMLWDHGATEVSIFDNIPVTPPDYNILNKEDIIIILPARKVFADEIEAEVKANGYRCYRYDMFLAQQAQYLYPGIYYGEIKV